VSDQVSVRSPFEPLPAIFFVQLPDPWTEGSKSNPAYVATEVADVCRLAVGDKLLRTRSRAPCG